MKRSRCSLLAVAALTCLAAAAAAHPGSGIALDRKGNVLFVDTGAGVWRLDAAGQLALHAGPAFHWMALDLDGRFGSTRLPSSSQAEMRAAGRDPGVILSSDYPVAIGGDGGLYHADPDAGSVALVRIDREGSRSVRAKLAGVTPKPLRWLNGIAAGAGGSILFTSDDGIYRVATDGKVSTVAFPVQVPDCAPPPADEPGQRPYLRGLSEDRDGTIWVAANGCSALLRVTPRGEVTVALRSESPWSPTAVTTGPLGVYVLEYLHTPGDDRRVWVPRVRRLSSPGEVVTLVTVRR